MKGSYYYNFFSIAVLIISGDVGLFMMQVNKTADLQLESGIFSSLTNE